MRRDDAPPEGTRVVLSDKAMRKLSGRKGFTFDPVRQGTIVGRKAYGRGSRLMVAWDGDVDGRQEAVHATHIEVAQ